MATQTLPGSAGSHQRIGVLLVNIGSPDEPKPLPVRRYLKEFLSDRRIVELPRWLWKPLLHGVILNTRSFKSARSYKSVWTDAGSPLIAHSLAIAAGVQAALDKFAPDRYQVKAAMRYGKPSLDAALHSFEQDGVTEILTVPLHPQYCASTVASTFDGLSIALRKIRRVPPIQFVSGYHDHPGYIDALAASVLEQWETLGEQRHLLMSYHSIPVHYANEGDPYPEQVKQTSQLLAERLNLKSKDWSIGYQSRFMTGRWLSPFSEDILKGLIARNVKRVSIIAPVFAADCLETLYDLNNKACHLFSDAGGEHLNVVPALNARSEHIEFLADLIRQKAPVSRLDSIDKSGKVAQLRMG